MKAYIKPNFSSRAVDRVVKALTQYAPPEVQMVESEDEADLIVLHINGRRNSFEKKASKIMDAGKKYAVVQYAIRSTKNPHTRDWHYIWELAELVWSYYDIPLLLKQDDTLNLIDFYHAPLGVDPEVFKITNRSPENRYLTGVCGQSYLTESTREVVMATKEAQGRVFFWGSELHYIKNVFNLNNISDDILAYYLNQCAYVSGLRRVEGFKLPAIEGLLCGARPIMFDKPHYRQWFDGLAVFIPEGTREDVIQSLVALFKEPYTPVTKDEIDIAKERFNWQNIVAGFWQKLL